MKCAVIAFGFGAYTVCSYLRMRKELKEITQLYLDRIEKIKNTHFYF